jgi:putative SOS response-associated peptidase YedK
MCGRGTQSYSWEEVNRFLGFLCPERAPSLEPRYNVAPTTQIDIVRPGANGMEVAKARWGLVPWWHKASLAELKISTFNARAETVRDAPTFRDAWRRGQRCIVPMNFYEWRRPRKKGQAPFYVYPERDPVLLLAGLWDEWTDRKTGEILLTATVITTPPNELIAPLHDRMPAVLSREQVDAWFGAPSEEAFAMLKPCPSDWLALRRVGAYVNDARNDGPRCIEPATDEAAHDAPKASKSPSQSDLFDA